MTEIITFVIGAVLGLVGGVLPTILSNRREEKCLKREKLEELYKDITKWYNNASSIVIFLIPVFDKRYDWNTYYDQFTSSIENKGEHIRSEIIISLYFPSMQESYDMLKKSVQELTSFVEKDLKHEYTQGHDISRYRGVCAQKFDICNKNFDELTTLLKEQASKLG
ncbi:MAG: hypothetical protein MJ250_08415 [Alphaproteobacteria bacterium]|nr:hypothetical protein [Alphaproteobacteria bacterium]